MNLKNSISMCIMFGLLLSVSVAQAVGKACKGKVLNPVTDICWQCLFPVKIGGASFGRSGEPAPGNVSSPVCACPDSRGALVVGVSVAFWEHARLIETVKDPYCFPALGSGMANPKPGFSAGDIRNQVYGDSEYGFSRSTTTISRPGPSAARWISPARRNGTLIWLHD